MADAFLSFLCVYFCFRVAMAQMPPKIRLTTDICSNCCSCPRKAGRSALPSHKQKKRHSRSHAVLSAIFPCCPEKQTRPGSVRLFFACRVPRGWHRSGRSRGDNLPFAAGRAPPRTGPSLQTRRAHRHRNRCGGFLRTARPASHQR